MMHATGRSDAEATYPGLSPEQIEVSRHAHGTNLLPPRSAESWWRRYLAQLADPVLRLLLMTAAIALTVGIFEGRYVDALGVILAVLMATAFVLLHEFQAQTELDNIKDSPKCSTSVVRSGNAATIACHELVVGDILRVEAHDELFADGRVLEAEDLEISEGGLTGEWEPVIRQAGDDVYQGCDVTGGCGLVEVTAVGGATRQAKQQIAEPEPADPPSPLDRQLDDLGKRVGVAAFMIAELLFLVLLVRGIYTGTVAMTSQQWCFTGIVLLSAVVTLTPFWLPVIYDVIELALGNNRNNRFRHTPEEFKGPAWLGDEGYGEWFVWLKSIGAGFAILVVGSILAYNAGLLPDVLSVWLPAAALGEILQYLMIALVLIVVALPEGLSASIVTNVAYGLAQMADEGIMVRRANAYETLGSVTVVCLDVQAGSEAPEDMRAFVKACRQTGIQVKLVTSERLETALETARDIGLLNGEDTADHYMTGAQLAELETPEEAALSSIKVLAEADEFNRDYFSKLHSIQGEVVAAVCHKHGQVTTCLRADVEIAIGQDISPAAKRLSDIYIRDGSFQHFIQAMKWSRSLYENVQRFIVFQLTMNLTACAIMLLGPFLGVTLPLTVVQLLWVNLIMDTFGALALATEIPHRAVLDRPPRGLKEHVLSEGMLQQIVAIGLGFVVVLAGLLIYLQRDGQVSVYELSVFFSVFVLLHFWNLFNARCLGHTYSAFYRLPDDAALLTIAGCILLGQVVFVHYGGAVFRTVPLSLLDWLLIIGGTSTVLWIGEAYRARLRRASKAS